MFTEVSDRKCADVGCALRHEWLEVNKHGSYASSTILNCNTRRYHGLLVLDHGGNGERLVTLSTFIDSLTAKGKEFHLTCHQYPNCFFPPEGHCLRRFIVDPVPHFIYMIGDVVVHKRLLLRAYEDQVLIRYDVEGAEFPMRLKIRPLFAFRDSHVLSHSNQSVNVLSRKARNGFSMAPYRGLPRLFVQGGEELEFFSGPDWFRNFEHLADRDRGYDYQEDLYNPGVMECELSTGKPVVISASMSECCEPLDTAWKCEFATRLESHRFYKGKDSEGGKGILSAGLSALESSAGAFFMRPKSSDELRINEGYHWLGRSTRDALIALPGLAFHSGRFEEGVEVLEGISRLERFGLIPDAFTSDDGARQIAVDTSLWFFWTVQRMLEVAPDKRAALRKIKSLFWPVMKRVVFSHSSGAAPEVASMNEAGLLSVAAEVPGVSWMDQCVDGVRYAPRRGFLVEVNALWYNALRFSEDLARQFGDSELCVEGLADRVRSSFQDMFWMPSERCLGDFSWEGHLDASVRPNQIIAASVPCSPLSADLRIAVVDKVSHELLTPCGLRSLSPREQQYSGRCQGGSPVRGYACHNGAAWPWLLCHFGEALLRDAHDVEASKLWLADKILPFVEEHLAAGCLGYVGEFFDGDPTQEPAGAVASARNHGEMIRLLALLTGNS